MQNQEITSTSTNEINNGQMKFSKRNKSHWFLVVALFYYRFTATEAIAFLNAQNITASYATIFNIYEALRYAKSPQVPLEQAILDYAKELHTQWSSEQYN